MFSYSILFYYKYKYVNLKIDHSWTPLAAVQHRWAAATSGCCSVRMCANVCEAMTHFTLARLIMQRLFEALDKKILTLRREQASSRPRLRILGQLEFLLKLSGKKITRVKSVTRNLFEKHAWTIRRHKKTKYNSCILLWPYVVVFNSIFRTFDIFAEYSKNIICRIYLKT